MNMIPVSDKYGLTVEGRPIIDARHALRIVLEARESGLDDGVVLLHHPKDFVGSSFEWTMVGRTKYADRYDSMCLCIRGRLKDSRSSDVAVVFK